MSMSWQVNIPIYSILSQLAIILLSKKNSFLSSNIYNLMYIFNFLYSICILYLNNIYTLYIMMENSQWPHNISFFFTVRNSVLTISL